MKEDRVQFRQKALAKLQSPEELDVPVRLARPQGWLVLVVTLAVMAAAGVWAVTGTVTAKLSAAGVLVHGDGSYLLQSPVAGQVTDVLAREGEHLAADAPLLKVRTADGERLVRTVAAGRLTSLAARIGTVVRTGADVATLERVEDPDEPLTAVLYVPGDEVAQVPAEAPVELTVQAVPAERYGTLRGRVRAVGRAPQNREQITGFLGDEDLAARFAGQQAPVPVTVRLDRSRRTPSGYAWSDGDGPQHTLDSLTPVGASLRLDAQHPAEWLLP